jgi:hypothetical protein
LRQKWRRRLTTPDTSSDGVQPVLGGPSARESPAA